MARGEIHIQLSVNYPEDPKVRALARFGRDARGLRDLYVQMVLYCKRNLSDGFVPVDELGVLVYPDGPKVGLRDAERLVEAGLVVHAEGGYRVPGFLKRNKSAAEVAEESKRKAAAGRQGGKRSGEVRRGEANTKQSASFPEAPSGGRVAEIVSRVGHDHLTSSDSPLTPSPDNLTPDFPDVLQIPSRLADSAKSALVADGDREANPKHSASGDEALCFEGASVCLNTETETETETYKNLPTSAPPPSARRDASTPSDGPPALFVVSEQDRADGPSQPPLLAAVASPPVTAQTLVGEYIERCTKRPPDRVIGQLSKEIKLMLEQPLDPDDIRRGLAHWMTRGLHPSVLASVVNEVMNTPQRSQAQAAAGRSATPWRYRDDADDSEFVGEL